MSTQETTSMEAIGPALGRVSSGLFIVTTRDEAGAPLGFLGSFVQQVALSPPTVCVAIGADREPAAAASGGQRGGGAERARAGRDARARGEAGDVNDGAHGHQARAREWRKRRIATRFPTKKRDDEWLKRT